MTFFSSILHFDLLDLQLLFLGALNIVLGVSKTDFIFVFVGNLVYILYKAAVQSFMH